MHLNTFNNDIEKGLSALFLDALISMKESKHRDRITRIGKLTLQDNVTQKQHQVNITIVLEPTMFGSTQYPVDAPFTTSVIEQLKQMEELNAQQV